MARCMSESGLLERLRSGDEAAFADLVASHGGRLLATARRLLSNEEDARDAVQEAFLRAFQQIDGFRGGAALGTWLHRIVVNAALMRVRARKRRPEEPIEAMLPQFTPYGHQVGRPQRWRPEDELEREELREIVRRQIAELPETYRTVLVLRDIEGLGTEETAEALGVSTSLVKVRLHRARLALRTLLDPNLREASP